MLIDPFFTGNPTFKGDRDAVTGGATHILISPGHADHIGDTIVIAEKTGAMVITNYELANWLGAHGVKKFDPMNTGDSATASPWEPRPQRSRCIVSCARGSLYLATTGTFPILDQSPDRFIEAVATHGDRVKVKVPAVGEAFEA